MLNATQNNDSVYIRTPLIRYCSTYSNLEMFKSCNCLINALLERNVRIWSLRRPDKRRNVIANGTIGHRRRGTDAHVQPKLTRKPHRRRYKCNTQKCIFSTKLNSKLNSQPHECIGE
ncbi:hypothetical protein Tsp_00359 [Trichinella spiralis]|uniref:hypothetical protein n=1 Tax=Trichinella spiralis TaxID=6334 RepID=UPI0001EFD02A|nr:hypothetical protein Tsp_00359 [Trichinella spiralis]